MGQAACRNIGAARGFPRKPWFFVFFLFVFLFGTGLPVSVNAQIGTRTATLIEFTGMVQVEPGDDVLTLEVKKEEIRFSLQDAQSAGQKFLRERFLSDLSSRTPSMYVRGPDYLLEELRTEKPNTRAIKMRGLYYSDSRVFVINKLSHHRSRGQVGP